MVIRREKIDLSVSAVGPFVLRWLGRLGSVLFVVLVVTVMVHNRGNPIAIIRSTRGVFLLFPLGMGAALILAWWRELAGGLAALACFATFFAVEVVRTAPRYPKHPKDFSGLVFALLAILFLASWAWRRIAARPIREASA